MKTLKQGRYQGRPDGYRKIGGDLYHEYITINSRRGRHIKTKEGEQRVSVTLVRAR